MNKERLKKLAGLLTEETAGSSDKIPYDAGNKIGVIYAIESEDDPYSQPNLYSIHKTREGALRALAAFRTSGDFYGEDAVITEYDIFD